MDRRGTSLGARRDGGGWVQGDVMKESDEDIPRWVLDLQDEMAGVVVEENDFEEDRCELPSCAPRLLTAGGYNRHHYEGEVRMHVRACVYACWRLQPPSL